MLYTFKGTPGPYEIRQTHPNKRIIDIVGQYHGSDFMGLTLFNAKDEQTQAYNAKLISCAPELFEMLKELIYDLEDIEVPTSIYDTINRAEELLKKASEL